MDNELLFMIKKIKLLNRTPPYDFTTIEAYCIEDMVEVEIIVPNIRLDDKDYIKQRLINEYKHVINNKLNENKFISVVDII